MLNQTISSRLSGQANFDLLTGSNKLAPSSARLSEDYGKLPLSFEANKGQTDAEVKFFSRGSGYSLFLTSSEAVLALSVTSTRQAVVQMKVAGADSVSRVEGLNELPARNNYFIGTDPSKWRTGIPAYAKVKYRDIYPGIDLVYYGNQQQLEYDFVVAPGADPKTIKLRFDGAESLSLDSTGDLILRAGGGEVRQHKPVIFQEVNSQQQEIAGRYVMDAAGEVGFEVGDYDASMPLVIDPVIVYSTFFGGSGDELNLNIAVGGDGSAYITGRTTSVDFPKVNSAQESYGGQGSGPGGPRFVGLGDAFVSRLNPEGSALIYSTYLGGSIDENATGIAVDGVGSAYITGMTNSPNFPTFNAIQQALGGGTCNFGLGDFPCFDAFVTKLNAAGSLVYSTYLGGNHYDDGRAIAIDLGGNAYITGNTFSANFPIMNPIKPALTGTQDSFVTKVSAVGTSLVYSTFIGGNVEAGEAGQGITVDTTGNAYVVGVTSATDFPVMNAVQQGYGGGPEDAYVIKINNSGSALVFSTYLGGSGDENSLHTIGLDSARNLYIAGRTDSTDFPVVNALQPNSAGGTDLFMAKLGSPGVPLLYSTYFGGSGNDVANSLVTDASGVTYIIGNTTSADFPTANALQSVYGGGSSDAFLIAIDGSGTTVSYSTYIGTAGTETGTGVALNRFGNVWVAGRTNSSAFPVVNALQPTYGGGSDGFVIKIMDAPESRGQCMNGGWQQFGPPAGPFKNQGDCIRYFSIRLIR